jgi:integrase
MKGYIRKRGDKYSFTVDIGKDPRTGKRKQKTVSGFRTKKEAQVALAELVTDVDKGNYLEPEKRKFKEFALNYIENIYRERVKKSTYEVTYNVLIAQLIPYFGETDLNDIDQFMIHEFYKEKKEKYASAYIQRMHELLRLILRVAYKWEVLQKDISSLIEAPRLIKKKMNVWTIDQVNAYLDFTQHSRYHPIFFLAAYTGMRKGEICGLTWDDIDFENKCISVNKTLSYITSEKSYILQTPKTRSSNRIIYMDEDIIKVLKKQRYHQNLEKLKYGGVYQDHNMVFAQETGDYICMPGVNCLFLRYIRQTELPRIRFHDLRHTHATILLQMGVNPKIVADRLGHTSVKITLDTYSHVLPSMQQDLSDKFSKAMRSGQNVVMNE